MEVLFNGDDLGATANVTQGIVACWQKGLLDGFSVLANGEVIYDLGKILDVSCDRLPRIAVHLNISEGLTVAGRKRVPLLVNDLGHLACDFVPLLKKWFLASAALKKDLLQQIEVEWREQIQKVRDLCGGRPICALDSHRYTHMLPFLFPIAARLADAFQIPEIRVAREVFYLSSNLRETLKIHFGVNLLKHIVLRICSWYCRPHIQHYALKTSDAILGVLYTGFMTPTAIASGIRKAKCSGIQRLEVIVHVGYADPQGAGRGHFDMNDTVRNRERLDLIRFHKEVQDLYDGGSRSQL